jgi:hypothetical protein
MLDFSKYLLSDSTLLDNCRAMHLVNSKDKLVPGLFSLARAGQVVKAGLSQLSIIKYRKRVIKGIFDSAKGLGTVDLELSKVVVVDSFYINIVLEAYLLKAGV